MPITAQLLRGGQPPSIRGATCKTTTRDGRRTDDATSPTTTRSARVLRHQQSLADMLKEATTFTYVEPAEPWKRSTATCPEDLTYCCCNFHGVVATCWKTNADSPCRTSEGICKPHAEYSPASACGGEHRLDPAPPSIARRGDRDRMIACCVSRSA